MANDIENEVKALFVEKAESFPNLNEAEISAVRNGVLTVLSQMIMEVGTLTSQFPRLLDVLIEGLIEAFSDEAARTAILEHRRSGDSEIWLNRGIANATIRYLKQKLDQAASVN